MIFEDAHWSDPTSLETCGRIVDRVPSLPVLLIVTFRPEFQPPWIGPHYVTALTLNRLAHRDIEAMIDRVVGNKLIPASVREDIIERTDGIPLFVEEMTKSVLEAGSEEEVRRSTATVPPSALAVPASLHASLMARLDRLGAAKEVAQIGAAIGREFSDALLAAAVRKPEAELQSALDSLVAAGLLFCQGVPPHASYLFKHALVQDAAYGTLLRAPRRALHARIAETLETQFAEIAGNQPELIARHCTEAGLIEKAANLWGKAGQRSVTLSAFVEGEEQLKRALAQIEMLPSTPALRREQMKLQVMLITPLIHTKGHAAPEAKGAMERAQLLIGLAEASREAPDDPLLLFSVLNGLWASSIVASEIDMAQGIATQILALAEKQNSNASLLMAYCNMGLSLMMAGEIAKGVEHYDRALALYKPADDRLLMRRSVQERRIAALYYRSSALWILGHPEAALADADHAVKEARELGQAGILMNALLITSFTHFLCANNATAAAQTDELVTVADQKSAVYWKALGSWLQGWVCAARGGSAEAAQMLVLAMSASRSTGAKLFAPMQFSILADSYLKLSQFDYAQHSISEAISAMETTHERTWGAEIYRIAGEIERRKPDGEASKAEAHFERSLTIARAQQAKSWELRAAMSMARLRRDQGKRDEARDLLAPVYGWFTEGFDTLDLKEAKALLEELAA
jgi:predicted ATPase